MTILIAPATNPIVVLLFIVVVVLAVIFGLPMLLAEVDIAIQQADTGSAEVEAEVDTSNSHAVEKHGSKAEIVRECMGEDDNILGVYPHSQDDEKKLWLCKIGPKLFGIQIRANKEGGQTFEITAFIKEKLTTLAKVKDYISNSGYIIGD